MSAAAFFFFFKQRLATSWRMYGCFVANVSSLYDSKNVVSCVCRIKIISNVMNTAKSGDKRQHRTLAQMEDTKSDHEKYAVGIRTDLTCIIPMVGR